MNFLPLSFTLACTLLAITPVYAQLSRETAPIATYTAMMGPTTIVSGGTTATVVRKEGRVSDRTVGIPVYIEFTSYSSKEQLQAITQAGHGNVVAVLSRYNHGKITVNGVSSQSMLPFLFARATTTSFTLFLDNLLPSLASREVSLEGTH